MIFLRHFILYLKKKDDLLDYIDLSFGDIVLELGANKGIYLKKVSKAIDKDGLMYTLDHRIDSLKICRTIIRKNSLENIIPAILKKQKTGLEQGSVNIVYSFGYGYLLKDLHLFLPEIHRILKSNGVFYLETSGFAHKKIVDQIECSPLWSIPMESGRLLMLVPRG